MVWDEMPWDKRAAVDGMEEAHRCRLFCDSHSEVRDLAEMAVVQIQSSEISWL